jgi:cytidylate kinase
MSVVIVTADAGCRIREIAEKAARELGYSCIGPEVLTEVSRKFQVPETKMEEALREPSSFLGRFSSVRAQHLAYFQSSFTAALKQDNLVYYGETGHLFISGVSHILKVMLTAALEDRIGWTMAQERISEAKAREKIVRDSETRQKWFQSVFAQDGAESGCFDLVINLSEFDSERAVKMIADLARDVKFQPITYSLKALEDQVLASRVRAQLVDRYSDVSVRARDGDVAVQAKGLKREKKDKLVALRKELEETDGVRHVELG